MNYTYIIIDDNQESILNTKSMADGFSELVFLGSTSNASEGLNLILEHGPKIIFLEIDPEDKNSDLSLALINEMYHYLQIIPKIIITTTTKEWAFDAIQYEVTDYMLKPIRRIDLVKMLQKIRKKFVEDEVYVLQSPILDDQDSILDRNEIQVKQEQFSKKEQPLIICIKSYGDYRYIDSKDICYFQADNNSTDIYLNNGEMVTAFKTLKHFESILSYPFVRIHNSYILNRNYISRIHTGNAVCYIKNTTTKLPFSKTYKPNVDLIIFEISNGNYLEI
jgi:DNA-binding LytR/AlgR family response regulator